MGVTAISIIWQPQPKQAEFLRRNEYEVLYGGAAGGGKSDALLAEALRQVDIAGYRGLLLRKTYPQLSELVDRSRAIYKKAFPQAQYNDTKHFWQFPSGAKIFFGSMQYTKDRTNYQGKRYDFIGFDELTHFEYDEYIYMFSRNRPSGGGTRCYIRATTNPGGIGHSWVKERFITAAPPLTPIEDAYRVTMPDGSSKTLKRSRIFVPSTVFDNKQLLESNPDYLASLAMLPTADREALLYGNWDSFEGQVFSEWRNNPTGYDERVGTHVIKPFKIPDYYKILRGFDFGYTRPFSVGWYAVSPDGIIYRIKELYGCTDTPNTGVKWTPEEIALKIKEIEAEDNNLKGKNIYGIADPSIFDKSRGKSIADSMAEKAVYWTAGDNTRLAGKMQFHYRLAFDSGGIPMLYVFSTCKHFIRTVPSLVYDTVNNEDVNTNGEDHIYDECRYVLMSNPIPPRQHIKPSKRAENPLATDLPAENVFWNL